MSGVRRDERGRDGRGAGDQSRHRQTRLDLGARVDPARAGLERVTPERWAEIEALFAAALERDPMARAALVRGSASAPDIADEVLTLLDHHDRADGFELIAPEAGLVEPGPKLLPAGTRLGAWEIER